jgi:gliding motility-associated-like protein
LCKYATIDLFSGRSYSGFDDELEVDWAFTPDSLYSDYETKDVVYNWNFSQFVIQAATIKVLTPLHVTMTLSDGTCQKISNMDINMYPAIDTMFDTVTGGSIVWIPDSSTVIGTEGNEIDVLMKKEYYWASLLDTNGVYYPGMWLPELLDFPPTGDSAIIKYIDSETPYYYGIGITKYGCVEIDTLFINGRNEIPDTLYNVFTPNYDGVNDFWEIPYADQYPELEISIYNRWGQLIYHRKGYGNTSDAMWDGRSMKNDKDLPMGTYLYVIEPNDGSSKPITGTVTIIR